MTIKLIIGLSNPGSAYAQTRHNVGAWFIETLAERQQAFFKVEKKFHGEIAHLTINDQPCKLLRSLTFMNDSGLPTREISQFYRLNSDEILVVHDELDLEVGRIKLKTGGGHGGHNGLRDIAAQLATSNYHRLRIGIGHPGHKDLVHDYVLGKPSQQEKQLILEAIERGLDIIPTLISKNIALAMNSLNSAN